MTRALFLPLVVGALAAACADMPTGAAAAAGERPALATASPAPALDPVVRWNRALLRIVRTPGAQPATVHPTRSFAILHAAIYDAVDAIDGTHAPYAVRLTDVPATASQDAAASAAAHTVLVALYPAFAAPLDDELRQSLTSLPADGATDAGLRVGTEVAARELALRSRDGSAASPVPYTFGRRVGDYQSTPPDFPAQPQFTRWAGVTPFALARASQFRPRRPPPLGSRPYADAVEEVRMLGVANGTTATADQVLTGRFWNGAIQNYWNEIAQAAVLSRHLTTAQSARLFALLDLTLADGVIAFYDAKYAYDRWRPVTAIRAAAADGNRRTVGDTAWLPLSGKSPPDPSYPGAHSVISAAAATVLSTELGTDRLSFSVRSEALTGSERHFERLSDAADEAGRSRIFAGVHFRFDDTAGQQLGRDVARAVLRRQLVEIGASVAGANAGQPHRSAYRKLVRPFGQFDRPDPVIAAARSVVDGVRR